MARPALVSVLIALAVFAWTHGPSVAQILRGGLGPAPSKIGDIGLALVRGSDLTGSFLSRRIDELDPGLADLVQLRAALDLAGGDDWAGAHAAIAGAHDTALQAFITWLDYRRDGTQASFVDIADFVARHPDWPQSRTLRRNAEAAIDIVFPGPDTTHLLEYFRRFPPLTGRGAMTYLRTRTVAFGNQGHTGEIRQTWINTDFMARDETHFLAQYGHVLTALDHASRLDRLAWERKTSAARRMYPHVDPGHVALAEARFALANGHGGVDRAIEAVPAALREDPALLYERLRWRRARDLDEGAAEILVAAPAVLERPDLWAAERNIMSRRALEEGNYAGAYELAGGHRLDRGARFAELEFLAGWIGLTYLDLERSALRRFTSLYHRTAMPISRARGAYWAGRAAAASGDDALARRWYEFAGRHPAVFYGQQALIELNRSLPPIDTGWQPGVADQAAFKASELVRIANALHALEEKEYTGVFLLAAGRSAATVPMRRLAARLAAALDQPHIAIAIVKHSIRRTGDVLEAGYPVLPLLHDADKAEPALILAVIRQESTFRRDAVSRAGARGLMQLMPGTAAHVARALGETYERGRLTTDQDYNIRIGVHFLTQLLQRYDGSYALAVAAYNAGPHRVDEWLETIGDPRIDAAGEMTDEMTAEMISAMRAAIDTQMHTDMLDWIESVPFAETRNYIQRVLEAVPVYRQILAASGATDDRHETLTAILQ
ncbi:MAG: lytic transglycosylase domain-containing protein [Alphaproteobacteria bacterium]|nr:lytic transglycosylase domain-containing protein [Alphaproteobacteria bacterium]